MQHGFRMACAVRPLWISLQVLPWAHVLSFCCNLALPQAGCGQPTPVLCTPTTILSVVSKEQQPEILPPPEKTYQLVAYAPATGWIDVGPCAVESEYLRINAAGDRCVWRVMANHIPEEAERGEFHGSLLTAGCKSFQVSDLELCDAEAVLLVIWNCVTQKPC